MVHGEEGGREWLEVVVRLGVVDREVSGSEG